MIFSYEQQTCIAQFLNRSEEAGEVDAREGEDGGSEIIQRACNITVNQLLGLRVKITRDFSEKRSFDAVYFPMVISVVGALMTFCHLVIVIRASIRDNFRRYNEDMTQGNSVQLEAAARKVTFAGLRHSESEKASVELKVSCRGAKAGEMGPFMGTRKKRPSDCVILSLMTGDMLICLLVIQRFVPKFAQLQDFLFDLTSCVQLLLNDAWLAVSMHNLLALTLLCCDLCVAIRRPGVHRQVFTCGRTARITVVIWLTSAVLGYSNLYLPLLQTGDDPRCNLSALSNDYCFAVAVCTDYNVEYVVIGALGLALLLHVASYGLILTELLHMRNQPLAKSRTLQRRYRRAFFALSLMFMAFAVCLIPYLVEKLLWITKWQQGRLLDGVLEARSVGQFGYYAFALLCSSPIINNLVFACRLQSIRESKFYRFVRAAFTRSQNRQAAAYEYNCNREAL